MGKKYLVRVSISSKEGAANLVSLVSPDENGDARLEYFYVADEEWSFNCYHLKVITLTFEIILKYTYSAF